MINFKAGSSTTSTSSDIPDEMLDLICKMSNSPAWGIMVKDDRHLHHHQELGLVTRHVKCSNMTTIYTWCRWKPILTIVLLCFLRLPMSRSDQNWGGQDEGLERLQSTG